MTLPVDIHSVAGVRELDRIAMEDAGIGGYALMTRAGAASVMLARERYPDARRWQVICGGGNNGGDGYVVARLAAEQGIAVSVLAAVPPDALQGDAERAYMDFVAQGGAVADAASAPDPDADLLVDGLLGSGIARNVEGRFADLVSAMNDHPAPVLALDMPSGLNGDDGRIMGSAVRADATLTFVGLKAGLFLGAGPLCAGALYCNSLDIPGECLAQVAPVLRRVDRAAVARALPRRARDAHKGRFGHVLVVGGGPGMPGAVRLTGEAALRGGAGLVTVATHPGHASEVAAGCPELMCLGLPDATVLAALKERATVLALGPGLGTGEWSQSVFDAALAGELPAVVDADALNLLASAAARSGRWILTPHPGEAARLLGCDTADIQADRRAAAAAIREQYGGIVVLKGAGTLVQGDGVPWIVTAGNPGMASAGMGDVLCGVIAALVAQGLDLETAARIGVQIHAQAGDLASREGERGMLATDLIAALRPSVNP